MRQEHAELKDTLVYPGVPLETKNGFIMVRKSQTKPFDVSSCSSFTNSEHKGVYFFVKLCIRIELIDVA